MHKTPIDEASLPRIRGNISKLSLKVLSIAYPMLMEAGLPNFPGKLRAHLM